MDAFGTSEVSIVLIPGSLVYYDSVHHEIETVLTNMSEVCLRHRLNKRLGKGTKAVQVRRRTIKSLRKHLKWLRRDDGDTE